MPKDLDSVTFSAHHFEVGLYQAGGLVPLDDGQWFKNTYGLIFLSTSFPPPGKPNPEVEFLGKSPLWRGYSLLKDPGE